MSPARIVHQATPLLTADVPRAIAFWTERVGFQVTGTWGEPPEFAILMRDGAYVMVGQAPSQHTIVPHWKVRSNFWNAYFWVDDARTLYAELKDCGAPIDYELCTQPYGVLEFGIQDLDGHDIAFGEVLKKP